VLKLLGIILYPLVFIYLVITNARNWFFDMKIFKISRLKTAKIISVGNITVGGSGKTPTVIMLGGMLKHWNRKVGILSRGYGRKSTGYVFVSNGEEIKSNVDECGDEMFFMCEELKVPAAVAERRVEGANRLIKETGIDTIILDDAYQHRWLFRDIDIVLFDQQFILKSGEIEQKLLPAGLMRETFASLKRADIIIINRKFSNRKEIPAELIKYFRNKPVFTGYYKEIGIFDVKTKSSFEMQDFQGQKSLVVCGVARPESFLNVLEKNRIDITNKMIFPDHKNYSLKEVNDIRKKFYETNSYSVLTTQKDSVKFDKYSRELDDIDIYYLKIELVLDEQEKFNKLILQSIN
jgi:tetraacyldisaccharide 4'-kinase